MAGYARARALRMYSVAILACLLTMLADAITLQIYPAVYDILDWSPDTAPISMLINFISAMTFTGELWGRHAFVGSNEAYWPIGFEVWYYVLFGALAFVRGPLKWLPAAGIAVVAGPGIALYFTVWAIGVICFQIVSAQWMTPKRSALYATVGCVCLAAGPCIFVLLKKFVPLTAIMYQGISFDTAGFCNWLYFNGIRLIFGLSIIGCHLLSPFLSPALLRVEKPVRWIAGGTFTLYLMHEPVLLCFGAVFHGLRDGVKAPLMMVCTLGVIALLAELGERRKHLWRRAGLILSGFGERSATTLGQQQRG